MSSNFDDYAFHRRIATYQVGFGLFLALGAVLVAAGISFLVTGATEVNHASTAQGESQNRMYTTGFKFIESGFEDFAIGLLIITVSGIIFLALIKRIPSPIQSRIEGFENSQKSNQTDLLKTNQQEVEIKNGKIHLEIENLRLELANLKLKVASQKRKKNKNKKNTNNHKKRRTGKKSNQ